MVSSKKIYIKSMTEYLFSFEGTPQTHLNMYRSQKLRAKSGDYSKEVTPVPISNTVVKLLSADDTWRAAAWESRTSPVLQKEAINIASFFMLIFRQSGTAVSEASRSEERSF